MKYIQCTCIGKIIVQQIKNETHKNELESNIATTSLLNQIKTIYHQDPDGGVYNLYKNIKL